MSSSEKHVAQGTTNLFDKYDVPVPRYTSYPTVPFWTDNPTTEQWLAELRKAAQDPGCNWAIYMHIPFCESLCTFCGCNNVITTDHGREEPYIAMLLKELSLYLDAVPELAERPLRQLHLGGGTPTFMSPENLKSLLEPALAKMKVRSGVFDASAEVNPRVTTPEHLKALYECGFTRVSMGVQDFDPHVQYLVNRIQPFEITRDLTQAARDMGYTSVNYDLIYGLPQQKKDSIRNTAELTVQLRPDRIALYSFAKVPWIKPAQRLFKDEDLPEGPEKRELYEIAREIFLADGYVEIGMDHFALPHDPLNQSQLTGEIHRNFMGYTEFRTSVLLGLGVSAISESPTCFHQNRKKVNEWERDLNHGRIPTYRGHLLNEEDRHLRRQILDFMTKLRVQLDPDQLDEAKSFLAPMVEDGLVEIDGHELRLLEKGKPFLRNATVFFDRRLRSAEPRTQIFSMAI